MFHCTSLAFCVEISVHLYTIFKNIISLKRPTISFTTDSHYRGFNQAQHLYDCHLKFKFTGFACTVHLSKYFLGIILPKNNGGVEQTDRGPGIFNYFSTACTLNRFSVITR